MSGFSFDDKEGLIPTKKAYYTNERLKNAFVGTLAVSDYIDELLERIHGIRASERQVCLRVRDTYAFAVSYQSLLEEPPLFSN